MLARLLHHSRDCGSITSALERRIQQLEAEIASLREPSRTVLSRIEEAVRIAHARSTRTVEEFGHAAESALAVGAALEAFARAMRARLPRGRAGGLARARSAWRYTDGTFMPEGERQTLTEQIEFENYERHAAGGRERAARAKRATDGTFIRE